MVGEMATQILISKTSNTTMIIEKFKMWIKMVFLNVYLFLNILISKSLLKFIQTHEMERCETAKKSSEK